LGLNKIHQGSEKSLFIWKLIESVMARVRLIETGAIISRRRRLPHLCSRFGKITPKLRYAFSSRCHPMEVSRCSILPAMTISSNEKHL
jgi:hypothetical protein